MLLLMVPKNLLDMRIVEVSNVDIRWVCHGEKISIYVSNLLFGSMYIILNHVNIGGNFA